MKKKTTIMIFMKRILIVAAIVMSALSAGAKTYTLSECVDIALSNNISLQQQRGTYEMQRLQYAQSKHNLLPSLSGNVGQNFSFGRATGADNVTVSQNMANTSFGLSANLLLFDGLGMKYRIDVARAQAEASEQDTRKQEADIRMNIATMFLQILLNKELLQVADTQLEASRLKVERAEQLVSEGRLAEGELYTLQAQYARDELSQTEASNRLQLSLLDLAQAMDIEFGADFDIAAPTELTNLTEILPSNDEVYETAVRNRPEVRAARLQLQAQQSALKSAKSAYSPSLSAGANFGTGYYHRFGASNTAFGTQLSDNLSTTVGLNLSIPIFDRMQTPNSVKRQQIQVENQLLQIERVKQTLRKEIDQAYFNALAAGKQQKSAAKAEQSLREAYRYAEQKFEAGRATSYEYYDAKNNYVKALSDALQAKYNYLFRLRILKYYMGADI